MTRAADLDARITALAALGPGPAPVVSVYLNTRWADEHQRDRVRVFLKSELRKAREAAAASAEDLDWVQAEGEALIAQARHADAHGVALFACAARGLREIAQVRAPFEDAFVVAETPYLRPLAAWRDGAPSALVVFLDGESARLIPLDAAGVGDEVALEHEVPGQHRRGGWAQLAQSRYQRHIQVHRAEHVEAVAEALAQLAAGNGIERIVLAGEARTLTALRKRLPAPIAARLAGTVPGGRREPRATLVGRALDLLGRAERDAARAEVDTLLVEAAKGGLAVAGPASTQAAVARGAVHRLYLLKTFRETGRACAGCGALAPDRGERCEVCGAGTRAVELGEAMVDRVLGSGGTVAVVTDHPGLAALGGVAARLRYVP